MQDLPYDPTKTKIIACAIVIEEMQPLLPQGVAYEALDFGLYLIPNNQKKILQQVIDTQGVEFSTLILGYGSCSMAAVRLNNRNCTLVIPREDDCIAIFLDSKNAYNEQAKKEPDTYYLTKGWIEVGDTPFEEYNHMMERFGEGCADRLIGVILKNYTRLAYIDTGQNDQQHYRDYARKVANKFNLRFEEIIGQTHLYASWSSVYGMMRFSLLLLTTRSSTLTLRPAQQRPTTPVPINPIPRVSSYMEEKESFDVQFQPIGKRVKVAAGTSVFEAARNAGIELASACGGEGCCGQCQVILMEGNSDLR